MLAAADPFNRSKVYQDWPDELYENLLRITMPVAKLGWREINYRTSESIATLPQELFRRIDKAAGDVSSVDLPILLFLAKDFGDHYVSSGSVDPRMFGKKRLQNVKAKANLDNQYLAAENDHPFTLTVPLMFAKKWAVRLHVIRRICCEAMRVHRACDSFPWEDGDNPLRATAMHEGLDMKDADKVVDTIYKLSMLATEIAFRWKQFLDNVRGITDAIDGAVAHKQKVGDFLASLKDNGYPDEVVNTVGWFIASATAVKWYGSHDVTLLARGKPGSGDVSNALVKRANPAFANLF